MAEKFRLAVSVGHTTSAPGARHENTNLNEHDVCMRYWAPLMALLETDRRLDVLAVQPGVPLAERIKIINEVHKKNPFGLAIELHMNSFYTPIPNYAEVYHYARRDGRSSVDGQMYGDAFLTPLAEVMGSGDGKRDGLSEPFGDEAWERERYKYVRGVDVAALVIEPAFLSSDDVAREIIEGGLIPSMAIGCYLGLVACMEA